MGMNGDAIKDPMAANNNRQLTSFGVHTRSLYICRDMPCFRENSGGASHSRCRGRTGRYTESVSLDPRLLYQPSRATQFRAKQGPRNSDRTGRCLLQNWSIQADVGGSHVFNTRSIRFKLHACTNRPRFIYRAKHAVDRFPSDRDAQISIRETNGACCCFGNRPANRGRCGNHSIPA